MANTKKIIIKKFEGMDLNNLTLEQQADFIDSSIRILKSRSYYKEHKEEFKKYNKKHYDKEYFKNYREKNPEKVEKARQNQIEKNSGLFIYFFFDFSMNVIYCGSTTLLTRIQQHFKGNTSIKMTFDDLCNPYTYDYMMTCYKDLTRYNLSRLELYFVEKFLKDNCFDEKIESPVYRNFDEINEDRKKFLQKIAIEEHFLDFDDKRYWDM